MLELIFDMSPKLIEALGNNPILYKLHMGKEWDYRKPWKLNPAHQYIGFHDPEKKEFYGMYYFNKLTNKMLDVHVYVRPEFWGKDISYDAAKLTMKYLNENTDFNVLITACPAPAKHAIEYAKRTGFEEASIFKNAIEYEGEVVDLHQLVYYIR